MEVGSMEIVGRLNLESMNSALSGLRGHLDSAKTSAKMAFGDISRIGSAAEGVLKSVGVLGAGIAGAFTTLATMSPQAAPYIEQMKTQFFLLSNTVGEVFEPIISMAAETFEGFVTWMGSPEGKGVLTNVKDIIMGIASDAGTLITKLTGLAKDWNIGVLFEAGGNIVEKYGLEALASLFGWTIAGPAGAALAGGTTAVLTAETGMSGALDRILGSTAVGAGTGAVAGSIIPGAGTLAGAGLGAVAGFGISGLTELYNYLTNPAYGGLATQNAGQAQVDVSVNINYPENDSEVESWAQMRYAHTGGG